MSRSKRLFSLGLFRRATARDDMREELEFHLEARVARLVARGMTPDAARQDALRRLGAPTRADAERMLGDSAELKERRLDVRDRFSDFMDDVRYALRGLVRSPGFSAIAILTLGIGIGANTAIYSAIDALLLRSLPFPEPSRLTSVVQTTESGGDALWSYPKFRFFKEQQRSYGTLAAYAAYPRTLTGADPERVAIEEVTGEYLRTLGIRTATGADFPSNIDSVAGGAQRLAIISDALWQRRFNADPQIVGKTLGIDNTPFEIVGVLPPGFRGLTGRADALINLTARNAESLAQAWSLEFSVVGRVRDNVSVEQASAEVGLLGPRVLEAFPQEQGTLTTSSAPEKWSAAARPLDTMRVAPALKRSLLVLFGAVSLVLLIACVNLANLLIARGLSRKQEIAVRLAIGAGRGRLVRLMVTESLVLAIIGGLASLGVAVAGVRALSAINPAETLQVQGLQGGIGVVAFSSIHLDARALTFAFGVTLFVGLVFGIVPALRATRGDVARDLRDGSAASGSARRTGVARRALVTVEVALALVLLAGSGLMIRSLRNLLAVDAGFDAHNVLTLRISVPPGDVAPDSMPGFYDELQRRIAGLSGVESVGLQDCPPLSGGCNGTIMTFADRAATSTGNAMIGVHWVTPSWFGAMRVPLKRGRLFTDGDRLGTPKVVLINEAAARKYFPGEDPIGKRVAVYQGGFHTGAEVIGIVGDVRYGTIDSTARPDAYISYGQARLPRMMVFVRTAGDPSAFAPAVRQTVRDFAPRNPVFDVRTMESRVSTSTAQARFSATLLTLFAIVALSLAALGVYGVMAFAVAQRTREIGIRVALGADRRRVLGMILRDGALLAGAGLIIGLTAALAFTRVLRTMLFGITPSDPRTYVAIAVLLGLVMLVASWIPARRAAAVDPMIALRRG
jgi:putative ABC transport system permease protein